MYLLQILEMFFSNNLHWHARSPDLTVVVTSYYRVLSYEKRTVVKPRSVGDLKVAMCEEVTAVLQRTLTIVLQSFEERLLMCGPSTNKNAIFPIFFCYFF